MQNLEKDGRAIADGLTPGACSVAVDGGGWWWQAKAETAQSLQTLSWHIESTAMQRK